MNEKENADKTVYPSLQTEQNIEETHEMVVKDNIEAAAAENVILKQKIIRRGALRSVPLVSVMFWCNLAGVFLLLVGFVTPGWVTLTAEQQLTSSYSGVTKNISGVYQDYAIWYVSQCCRHDGGKLECETMTYRSIAGLYAEDIYSFDKVKIDNIVNEIDDIFLFNGAALVFGYWKLSQMQTMYTIGLLISLELLYRWYDLRKNVVKVKCQGRYRWLWIFQISLTVLAVILVFIVVFTFIVLRGKIGFYARPGNPVGLLYAVFGGSMMVIVGIVEFIQIL